MTALRLGDDFAFADVVRISALFEYTGEVNSRQNQAAISLFRCSAKRSIPDFGLSREAIMVTAEAPPVAPTYERRVQVVLALFRGASVAEVSRQYRIGRSDLYKFRARALEAMREALKGRPRGPKRPHNRLDPHREEGVVAFCQRHRTLSSSQVHQQLGANTPSPRTIQRVRERHSMARVPKRAPPTVPRRRPSPTVKARAAQMIQEKWHLGALGHFW